MDFPDKARIRIEHWLKHNEFHITEYDRFVEELEAAGMQAGAEHIREMIAWTTKGNACLRKALKVISNGN